MNVMLKKNDSVTMYVRRIKEKAGIEDKDVTFHCSRHTIATLQYVKRVVDKRFHPDGYNIGINVGQAAGQSVYHCHMHLIPRYAGDVENPKGGVRGVIPKKQKY